MATIRNKCESYASRKIRNSSLGVKIHQNLFSAQSFETKDQSV